MKNALFIFILLISGQVLAQKAAEFESKSDAFFKEYVSGPLIKYKDIKENPAGLNELMGILSEVVVEGLSENEAKSLLLNAYNICVIKQIVDNYPITSPNDIVGFFDATKFKIGPKTVTLNYLENEWLRELHPDARLHVALVCGATGCPPIADHAYKADELDAQLDEQARIATVNPKFIRYDAETNTVHLSAIFKWYKADFLIDQGSEIDFINAHSDLNIPADAKIMYQEYDWSINDEEKKTLIITLPVQD